MRRVGELLNEIERQQGGNRGGGRGNQGGTPSPKVSHTRAARDGGLSNDQRKQAQRVANVPEEEFEQAVESEGPPTVSKLAEQGTRKKQPSENKAPEGKNYRTSDCFSGFLPAGKPLFMWVSPCAIITTPPTSALREIHNRMLLIIRRHTYDEWLQGDDPGQLIQACSSDLQCYPVSTLVNDRRNDDLRCIEPLV